MRIEGIMDHKLYLKILSRKMLKHARDNLDDDWIFQHDNDPKHKAGKVTEWFETKGVEVLDWPAQSPDLNPIEHLWEHVDRQIRSKTYRKTDELFDAVVEAWNSIPDSVISTLIESMPRRCAAVIAAKGYVTKY